MNYYIGEQHTDTFYASDETPIAATRYEIINRVALMLANNPDWEYYDEEKKYCDVPINCETEKGIIPVNRGWFYTIIYRKKIK